MQEEETTSARQQGGEMVREVCDKMLDPASTCKACDFVQCPMLVKFAADIRAAHEREMAAKDAEIARLKAALKPVMECCPFYSISQGEAFDADECINSVREAQRIMKEGETK